MEQFPVQQLHCDLPQVGRTENGSSQMGKGARDPIPLVGKWNQQNSNLRNQLQTIQKGNPRFWYLANFLWNFL